MPKDTICLVMCTPKREIKVPPFPLMFLSKGLKNAGFKVKIFHIGEDKVDLSVDEIVSINPLFVGFSVLTGLPTLYSVQMSKKIKKLSSIPIVWGGIHTSITSSQCLNEDYIDIVSVGESENTIVELAKALSGGADLSKIKGIGFKKDGKSKMNKAREFPKKLDDYRMDMEAINWNDYIETQTIEHKGKSLKLKNVGYYASRGCPHNCGFCYNKAYYDRKYREHNINHVLEDIEYLKKNYGIRKIHFWDDNFFVKKERALEILEKINLYSGVDIRIDYITNELAKKLYDLNVVFFLIGAESGSDRILKLVNKSFTVDEMFKGVKILAKYGLDTLYSFILGYPTETKEELYETIDFMEKISRTHPKSSFTVGAYLPYPGTELYELCLKEGFTPFTKTEDWNLLDRWRNSVKLLWLDPCLALNIRHLFYFLTAGNKLFKWWCRFRIKKKYLYFDLDIKLMIKLSGLFK